MIEIPSEKEFLIDKFWAFLLYAFTFLPFQLVAAYFIAYVVVPQFILKRKFILGIILIIVSSYSLSVLLRIVMVHFTEPLVRTPPIITESIFEIFTDLPHLIFKYVIRIYQVVVAFLLIKYFMNFKDQKEKNLLIEKARIESELKMLKMQLSPHFLFNTLNNIYTLALLKSDQAPEAIGRLSKMLDYIIYNGDKKFVGISKEIGVIENYIELQRLRHSNISVKIEKSVSAEFPIAPLILLSLVENAFKHSGKDENGQIRVSIKICASKENLSFMIWNTKKEGDLDESTKKIGNKNLIQQLKLSYPAKYKVDFENQDKSYSVKLILDI